MNDNCMNDNCMCIIYNSILCKSLKHNCICNTENNKYNSIKIVGMGFFNYKKQILCKHCNKYFYK